MRLIAVFLIGLACVSVNAATLTVGPGRDYSTIGSAVTASTAGDTISVYSDSYSETVTINKSNLTVQAASGESPILTGRFSVSATNATIRGLVIQGWTGDFTHGISMSSHGGLTVEGCIIRNGSSTASGVYVRNSNRVLIRSNVIHGCSAGININSGRGTSFETGTRILQNTVASNHFDGIQLNAKWVTVDQNLIFNNFDTNWAATHPDGIQFISSTVDGQAGVQEAIITRNWIFNHTQNIFTSLWTTNALIANNVCFMEAGVVNDVDLDAIATKNIICLGGTGIAILNNTLGRCNNSGINIDYNETQPRMAAIVRNNVIMDVFGSGIGIYVDNEDDLAELDNNLYFNNAFDARIASTYYETLSELQSGAIYEDSGLSADPGLTNYRPGSGSPVVGAGFDASAYFTDDHDGNARGIPWDIGAFEYQAPSGVTATASSATVGTIIVQ